MPWGLPAATSIVEPGKAMAFHEHTGRHYGFEHLPRGRKLTLLHWGAEQDGWLMGEVIICRHPAYSDRLLAVPPALLRLA
jgi:hypothetical protein